MKYFMVLGRFPFAENHPNFVYAANADEAVNQVLKDMRWGHPEQLEWYLECAVEIVPRSQFLGPDNFDLDPRSQELEG